MGSFNWKSVADHIYLIINKPTNSEYIEELRISGIMESGISSFVNYIVDKPNQQLKHFKKEAIYRAIRDAYIHQYSRIIIIPDNVKFNVDNFELCFKECKDWMYNILNTDDICEDCLIMSREIINYIAKKPVNLQSNTWWEELNFYTEFNYVKHKTSYPICHHTIDYVVTFVDSTNELWQKQYSIYKADGVESFNQANRWRPNYEVFKWHLKKLNENCPWINKIYLVVSSLEQVPIFARGEKIKIILHKDIIPEKFLPTFNSCTIEMFLGNIKNLSEYYIYANDDMITLNALQPTDFFNKGRVVSKIKKFESKGINYHRICINNLKLLSNEFDTPLDLHLGHMPHPMLKSTYSHIWELYSSDIENSISRFRKNFNYNQYIFTLYDYFQENYEETKKFYKFYKCEEDTNLHKVFKNNFQYDFLCINDNSIKDIDIYYDESLKVAVCAIAKNENLYIKEWVEWYKNLGICKIFLYDNNDTNGEHFEDVINDYIKTGFVEVINKRGVEKGCVYDEQGINLQTACYIDAYENKCKNIDWICFFDIDEFLQFKNNSNLQEFLNRPCFYSYDTICVSWEHYDDNNLLEYDSRPVTERFTKLSKIDKYGLKSICKTDKVIHNKTLKNMIHCFRLEGLNVCYADGTKLPVMLNSTTYKSWWLIKQDQHNKSDVVLNHYKTKSLNEYIDRHLGRHWGTSLNVSATAKDIHGCLFDYFNYNDITQDKLNVFKKHIKNNIVSVCYILINKESKCNINYIQSILNNTKKYDMYWVVVKYKKFEPYINKVIETINPSYNISKISYEACETRLEILNKIYYKIDIYKDSE